MAAAKGRQSRCIAPAFILAVTCQSHPAASSVAAGSSMSASVRGKSNHLSRTVALTIGVARLTSATPSPTHSIPHRVQPMALRCSAPSVLKMSHVAPSST